MGGLRRFFSWFRFESQEKRIARLIREETARIWGSCPLCSRSPEGHAYQDLAFAAAGSAEDAEALERTRRRDWSGLGACREADIQSDLHVWQVLRCPSGGKAVAVLLSPYDYLQRGEILERIVLSPEESAAIDTVLDGEWNEL